MTVIGRDLYSEDMVPGRRYRPSACPRCKAQTLDEAAANCRPVGLPSGDYECPGDTGCLNPFGIKWDLSGRACELTRESAAEEGRLLDEWCREMIASDHRLPTADPRLPGNEGGAA